MHLSEVLTGLAEKIIIEQTTKTMTVALETEEVHETGSKLNYRF